ncbi:hypothetical protein BGX27_007242 [Mortierella sp. AM989]|nr:hypothetical protein BGX27_007242 [Mortierella sp. AM989]
MGLYPACNLPWIDTVVNNYVANATQFTSPNLMTCCTAPGQCDTKYTGRCPLGNLDCTMGNTKYACTWDDYTAASSRKCYQEGPLIYTRNLPCCPSELPGFFKSASCLPAFGTIGGGNTVCCTSPGKCQWTLGCIGYDSYNGHAGETIGVYHGFDATGGTNGASLYCVQEMALGRPVGPDEDCLAIILPTSGCALSEGGSATTIRPTASINPTSSVASQTPSTTSASLKPSATPTDTKSVSEAHARPIKWVMLCVFAPTILQLLLV